MTNIPDKVPDNVPEKNRRDYRLIKGALECKEGKRKLKKYIEPLVQRIVTNYQKDYQAPPGDLTQAAWKRFDWAVEKYWGRLHLAIERKKECYHFSTYYTWVIKTSIETYLGIAERPDPNIVPQRLVMEEDIDEEDGDRL